jgi:hypothetical protein
MSLSSVVQVLHPLPEPGKVGRKEMTSFSTTIKKLPMAWKVFIELLSTIFPKQDLTGWENGWIKPRPFNIQPGKYIVKKGSRSNKMDRIQRVQML